MEDMLRMFYSYFCKVEFLCWDGVPNWLGSIVIAIGIIVVSSMVVASFAAANLDREAD
jgi:hypothetical protein